MNNPWKTHSSKVVLKNGWWQVAQERVTRPDGSPGEYNIAETGDAVCVVALTDQREIIMIEQFRYVTGALRLEVPGGAIDSGNPLYNAKRELREETGITAGHWTALGSVQPLNGMVRETLYIFLAQNLNHSHESPQQAEAITKVLRMPLSEVIARITAGDIDCGQSISAIFKAALYLGIL